MIAKNLFNPIPLHQRKADWYDEQPTYKGAYNPVIAPNGYLLPMQLTIGQPECPTLEVEVTFDAASRGTAFTGNLLSDDGIITLVDAAGDELAITDMGGYYRMEYTPSGSTVSQIVSRSSSDSTAVNMTESEMRRTDTRSYYLYDSSTQSGKITVAQSLLSPRLDIAATVVRMADGVETALAMSPYVDVVPTGYRTYDRFATMVIGGESMEGTMADGMYYLRFTLGDTTYYSEPWVWMGDTSKMIHLTYRRTDPILTADNYMPFATNGRSVYMEMWVNTIMAKPPYSYESEVKDEDGYKFVQKQVSYRKDSFTMLCTGYTAEALRMMWHCDNIVFTYRGVTKRVDWMEAPEPSWDTDTHLCEVTVEFQTDTIMQTNGNPKMPIDVSGNKWSSKTLPADLKAMTDYSKDYDESYD